MISRDTLPEMESLQPGDHLFYLYESEKEHHAVITDFLRKGFEKGEKVIYLLDLHTEGTIKKYLRDDGIQPEPLLESGQFSIYNVDDIYLKDGYFDPDRMIHRLEDQTESALAEGCSALRVTGEMDWALHGRARIVDLIEYESKVNNFFPGSNCLGLCQYDRRRSSAEVLLEVLAIHPLVIVGTEVFITSITYPPRGFLLMTGIRCSSSTG
jgi:hypothetical protein